MALTITKEAANWYIQELELKQGDYLRFFGKVYGPHNGFSVGINKQSPDDIFFEVELNGVHFYVEKFDEWFFNGQYLEVTMREDGYEPVTKFVAK